MIERCRFLGSPTKLLVLAGIVLGIPQAAAHISYSGRNFGAFNADGNDPVTFIASNSVTSDFGWASGIDESLGDSHKLLPYRFAMKEPGFVTITVEGSSYSYTSILPLPGGRTRVITNVVAGLEKPAFSLCAGLAHPSSTDHDKSPSSLTYLDFVSPQTMTDGCFDALGNWCIGRDSATDLSDLTRFRYIGNAYDGPAADLAPSVHSVGAAMDDSGAVYRFTNDAIHGDAVQDGAVTATYFLTPGDYSLFVGGGNYYWPENLGGNTNRIFGVKVTMAVDPPLRPPPGIPGYKVGWGLASGLTDSSWSDTNTITPPQWTQIYVRDSSAMGTDAEGTVYGDNANPGGMRWLSFPAVQSCIGNGFLAALQTNGAIALRTGNSAAVTFISDPLHPFLSMEAARDFIVALKYDETVTVWSEGGIAPTNVPADLTNAVAVAAGSGHVIALRKDGTVATWGTGSGGQLIVPTDLSGVVQVAAGDGFSAALRSDGSAVAWGALTLTIPSGTNPVVQIAAGSAHLAALFSDGTVQCWGDNSAGQCTAPKGLGRVLRIACGGRSTMVLTSEKRVAPNNEEPSQSPSPSPEDSTPTETNIISTTSSGVLSSGSMTEAISSSASVGNTAPGASRSTSKPNPEESNAQGHLALLQPSVIAGQKPTSRQVGLSGSILESAIPAQQVTEQEENARPSCACCVEITMPTALPTENKPYSSIPNYSLAPAIPAIQAPPSKIIPRPVDPRKKTRTLYKLNISIGSGDGSPRTKGSLSDNGTTDTYGDSAPVSAESKESRDASSQGNDHQMFSGFKTFVQSVWMALVEWLFRLTRTN